MTHDEERPFADEGPFLVVRARIDELAQQEFRRWYRAVHRPHMLAIPGAAGAHAVRDSDDAAWLILLQFEPGSDIEDAMRSPEAEEARRDWNKWRGHLHHLAMEVYAPLFAMSAMQHRN